MGNNYIIISGAYNEEAYIERTIKTVIKQTIWPLEWIIVNDGSVDGTEAIVRKYLDQYPWIKLFSYAKGSAEFGTHAVVNFYKGFEKIKKSNWEYIVKLDTDLDIDRKDFFETQINYFNSYDKLGVCSGITYSVVSGKKVLTKGRHYWRTGGAMKMYRKECFNDIGGLKPLYGWDGLDEYQAMFKGWKTRTLFDLHVNHLGKKRALNREQEVDLSYAKGLSLYKRGYPIEFVFLNSFKLFAKRGKYHWRAFINGYFEARQDSVKQFVTDNEKKFIRRFQYRRVIDQILRTKKL